MEKSHRTPQSPDVAFMMWFPLLAAPWSLCRQPYIKPRQVLNAVLCWTTFSHTLLSHFYVSSIWLCSDRKGNSRLSGWHSSSHPELDHDCSSGNSVTQPSQNISWYPPFAPIPLVIVTAKEIGRDAIGSPGRQYHYVLLSFSKRLKRTSSSYRHLQNSTLMCTTILTSITVLAAPWELKHHLFPKLTKGL